MPSMPWFRFYSETLNDRKIKRICSATGQPKALIVGVWATILALANDSPERGKLMISDNLCVTTDELCEETGLDEESFSLILVEFVTLDMIELDGDCWIVCKWEGRQFKSDHSSPRVAKHREKKRQEEEQEEQEGNVSEQLQEQSGGVIDTESETDTKSERESEKNPLGATAPVPSTFPEWQGLVTGSKNKPAVIRHMIQHLFQGREPPEFGRIGKCAGRVGGYGRLADLLWQHSSRPPTGNVLDYIEGVAKGKAKRSQSSNQNLITDTIVILNAMSNNGRRWKEPRFADPFVQQVVDSLDWYRLGEVTENAAKSMIKDAWFKVKQR